MLQRTPVQYDAPVLPDVTRDDVLKAFVKFDRELRGNENWANWETKESQKYAIEHEGRRYPPKMILALAAGVPVGNFSGGLHGANRVIEGHGFRIIPLADKRAARPPFHVFWVNQGATYVESRSGGFIWAPKRDRRGVTPGHWRRLEDVTPGDVFVHYSEGAVRAIGRALSSAEDAQTPFQNEQWITDGRRIAVEYFDLGDRAIPIARVATMFRDFELEDGPFTESRGVKQGYLWDFNRTGLQQLRREIGAPWPEWADMDEPDETTNFDLQTALEQLTVAVARRGFVFEPWQIAGFVTALRTKPFVILAGVSGTGKSRLPCLIADAVGCTATVVPVRPDWTDSSDVLGYVDLQGTFRPGPLVLAAERAMREADTYHMCIVDEMNLARVEHYFAEVLSRIESRVPSADGRLESSPLLTVPLADGDVRWAAVRLPSNLAIVGTVNMDESAHGFSRKVLDRAFTIELSDVDLREFGDVPAVTEIAAWSAKAWASPGTLAQRVREDAYRASVQQVIDVLVEANTILAQAQLQVGYRTRDEVAMFVLNATEVAASFVTRDGSPVDPLDLALMMKLLPRIAGGSAPVRQVVLGLLGFATGGKVDNEQAAEDIVSPWRAANRPAVIVGTRFPRTAARLCMMWDRLSNEGFTSFWL